jgi:RHS repeat-associated protein
LPERERVYAAGRLLFEGGKFVATDRLGSVIYKCSGGLAMQNGGFETGATNWTPYGGAQHGPSTVARSGGLSLRQTVTTTDTGIYQDISGLIPGKSYQFQAFARAETASTMAELTVSDTAGNNLARSYLRWVDTNWQQILVIFTATLEGKARVRLVKWDTADALLWDDVELVNGATATSGLKMRYYPYGQEVGTATANDVAKFGTYTRDSATGLDYAMNRYYQSWWGRFTNPDPYRESVNSAALHSTAVSSCSAGSLR